MKQPNYEKALTKADTSALWHAVQAMGDMCKAMKGIPELSPETIAAEDARHKQAKRALRKVQELRGQGL